MTTCVYSEGVLASDTQITTGNIPSEGQKIYQNDHLIVAYAGSVAQALKLITWLLEFKGDPDYKPDLTNYDAVDYDLIVVDKLTKECWTYEGKFIDYIPLIPPVAIGSGSNAALGALHAMKMLKAPQCAKTAVKAAMKTDICSGGRVKAIDLNPKKPKQKKAPKKGT